MTEAGIKVFHKDLKFITELQAKLSEQEENHRVKISSINPPIEAIHGVGHESALELAQEGIVYQRVQPGETSTFTFKDWVIKINHDATPKKFREEM